PIICADTEDVDRINRGEPAGDGHDRSGRPRRPQQRRVRKDVGPAVAEVHAVVKLVLMVDKTGDAHPPSVPTPHAPRRGIIPLDTHPRREAPILAESKPTIVTDEPTRHATTGRTWQDVT